jgi:hypothetical protein
MKKFEGDRLLHKQITEERVATAWGGRDVIFGGELTKQDEKCGNDDAVSSCNRAVAYSFGRKRLGPADSIADDRRKRRTSKG